MKAYIKLWGTILIVAILLSCKKDSTPINGNEDITIEIDKNFIHFSAGIQTKGVMIEDKNLLNRDFAVLGYQYRSDDWTTAEIKATPNVFYNAAGNLNIPQIIEYDEVDKIYTYSPIQAWTGNLYSFFGYYPCNNTNVKLYGGDTQTLRAGTPYITYSLPSLTDPTKMIDLMTAAKIDTKFGEEEEVVMRMYHRLSALDIGIHNYSEYKLNDEEEPRTVQVEITGYTLKLNVAESAKFYLDRNKPTEIIKSGPATGYNLNVTVSNKSYKVGPTGDNVSLITGSTDDTTLLLIPQNSHLTGTIQLTYKKKYQDGEDSWIPIYSEAGKELFQSENIPINFSTTLTEGRHYYIDIIFTSSAITVQGTVSNEWTYNKVTHEFE